MQNWKLKYGTAVSKYHNRNVPEICCHESRSIGSLACHHRLQTHIPKIPPQVCDQADQLTSVLLIFYQKSCPDADRMEIVSLFCSG